MGKEFIVVCEWNPITNTPPTVTCFDKMDGAMDAVDVAPLAERITIHQHKNNMTTHIYTKEKGIGRWIDAIR